MGSITHSWFYTNGYFAMLTWITFILISTPLLTLKGLVNSE